MIKSCYVKMYIKNGYGYLYVETKYHQIGQLRIVCDMPLYCLYASTSMGVCMTLCMHISLSACLAVRVSVSF